MPRKIKSIPVSEILIPEQRDRSDLGDLRDLEKSISLIGLVNPIVVTEDNYLIAGERRLTAHRNLGIPKIDCFVKSQLTPAELAQIELDENVRRKSLTWLEEVQAIAKLHTIRSEENPDWTQANTAEILSTTDGKISEILKLKKEIDTGNELVLKAESKAAALGIANRAIERRRQEAKEAIRRPKGVTRIEKEPDMESHKINDDGTIGEIVAETYSSLSSNDIPEIPENLKPAPLLLMDFEDWATTYEGPRFNFIHCDFPYGINADKQDKLAADKHKGFEDTPEVLANLLDIMESTLDLWCADDANILFWYDIRYYHEFVKERLSTMGLDVEPRPLVWGKSDNSGAPPIPGKRPRNIYESAFLAHRGNRPLVRATSNVYWGPTARNIHMSEKPRDMFRYFFRMFVDDTTRMLDPTCGSGNAVRVAHELGAKEVLGLEKDPTFHQDACIQFWKEDDEINV